MADLFASAKTILRRADHHIADMALAIKTATPTDPYTYVIEQESKTGDYVHKIRFPTGFNMELSCIMFDAVNNLRACLDQFTNSIAIRHRGTPKRDTHFAPFPFANNASCWPNRINGLKNDIPLEIRALFEAFKPYKGGNNTLWALNHVANIKKHAELIKVWYEGTKIKIPAGSPIVPTSITPAERTTKDEIEIYRSSDPPNRHPNIQISYSIIVDHPEEIIQGQPPVTLLNAMRSEVERILLGTEAECRRIGLIP